MRFGGGTGKNSGRRFAERLTPIFLILAVSAVYLTGLHPGIDAGDSAELQLDSPLLGICHPPGYQIEVTIGKLWSLLPIGTAIAWRINLLMVVCGVIGCGALYGAVRRVTGQIFPGVVAALALGFSSVYWSHALVAEAYVFYASFLLAGIYAAVRFFERDRARWLYLSALSIGVAVGDRPSELSVLPAFAVLGFGLRDRIGLGGRRAALALALLVLPFLFSIGCFLARNHPDRLAIRDDAQRDEILQDVSKEISRGYGAHATAAGRVAKAAGYCLGLDWVGKPGFRIGAVGRTIGDYAALLAGTRAFAGGVKAGEENERHAGKRGASIGIAGLALAAIASRIWRRRPVWVLFGWTLFAGNLLFILWHHSWDNLTFTVPGIAGLAFLVGLGAARVEAEGWAGDSAAEIAGGPDDRKRPLPETVTVDEGPRDDREAQTRGMALADGTMREDASTPGRRGAPGRGSDRARQGLAVAAVLFLALGNFASVGRSGEAAREKIAYCSEVGAAPWPGNAVILCSYWPAMTFRYVLYIESGRRDMQVLCADPSNYMKLIRHFGRQGRSVFLMAGDVAEGRRDRLDQVTPREIAQLGFLLANPPGPGQER